MSYLREKLPEAETSPRDALFLAEPWRKVLWDAADRIVQRGHCKNVLVESDGRVCMRGAIFDASFKKGGPPWIIRDDPAAAEADRRMQMSGFFIDWNNAPERTAGEVIAKLREVALS